MLPPCASSGGENNYYDDNDEIWEAAETIPYFQNGCIREGLDEALFIGGLATSTGIGLIPGTSCFDFIETGSLLDGFSCGLDIIGVGYSLRNIDELSLDPPLV